MTKLEQRLPDLYTELHSQNAFKGDAWATCFAAFKRFIGAPKVKGKTAILDFGCGPSGGLLSSSLAAESEWEISAYDPYIKRFCAKPWGKPKDIFFSCDVFEHMTIGQLVNLGGKINDIAPSKVFISLSTRPANKIFSNGINVHITIESAEWWAGFLIALLASHYELILATADLRTKECIFGFERKANENPAA
jgi:hypothetical protein